MKSQYIILFILLLGTVTVSAQSNTAKKAKNTAVNETEKQINNEVRKGVKSLFSKKNKKKKKDEEAEADDPNNPPEESSEVVKEEAGLNTSENDPTETSKDEEAALLRRVNEFERGEIEIFSDDLAGEQLGEFPLKWDKKTGTIETMRLGSSNVIGFVSWAEIMPLMDREEYLPEKFTLEFDCYFHNNGNEGYYVKFGGGLSFRVNPWGIAYDQNLRVPNPPGKGWRRIAVSFNKRALKVYYDGKRLVNDPRISYDRPTSVMFSALVPGSSQERFAFIRNIHIAEGAVPLYERLITDGKIVTNDIHFDYNEATLKKESYEIIGDFASMLHQHPEVRVQISGHTDPDGSADFNKDLSQRRADAVKNAMVAQGIEENRMTTIGYGEEKPLTLDKSDPAWHKNRRVEFELIK